MILSHWFSLEGIVTAFSAVFFFNPISCIIFSFRETEALKGKNRKCPFLCIFGYYPIG